MTKAFREAAQAAQAVLGLAALTSVAVVGDQLDMPFRVANFVFLAVVVACTYHGARFLASVILATLSAGILLYEFTPVAGTGPHWNVAATVASYLAIALVGCKIASQAAKNAAPVAVAAFAGIDQVPVYRADASTRTLVERSAPMVDPPFQGDAAELLFFE
jgi:hypothetical protein